jgi:hypothetical protein
MSWATSSRILLRVCIGRVSFGLAHGYGPGGPAAKWGACAFAGAG